MDGTEAEVISSEHKRFQTAVQGWEQFQLRTLISRLKYVEKCRAEIEELAKHARRQIQANPMNVKSVNCKPRDERGDVFQWSIANITTKFSVIDIGPMSCMPAVTCTEEIEADTKEPCQYGKDRHEPEEYSHPWIEVAKPSRRLENRYRPKRNFREENADLKPQQIEQAFLEAAAKGMDDIVRQLVCSGTNVNATDMNEKTALHHATTSGHSRTVRLLLTLGANSRAQDCYGCSALHIASCQGDELIARMLISKRAKPEARDRCGRTALCMAARGASENVTHYLINAGAEVNALDHEGNSVLHYAASCNAVPILAELVKNGAHVTHQNLEGDIPLDVARRLGKLEAVMFFE